MTKFKTAIDLYQEHEQAKTEAREFAIKYFQRDFRRFVLDRIDEGYIGYDKFKTMYEFFSGCAEVYRQIEKDMEREQNLVPMVKIYVTTLKQKRRALNVIGWEIANDPYFSGWDYEIVLTDFCEVDGPDEVHAASLFDKIFVGGGK